MKILRPIVMTLLLPICAAIAQEREWALDAQDEDAFLLFGVPETDDVALSFWCKIGTGKLKLFVPETDPALKQDEKSPLRVQVGENMHEFVGQVSVNDEASTKSIETELSTDHAILNELKTADVFRVTTGPHTLSVPLADADITALLKLCMIK